MLNVSLAQPVTSANETLPNVIICMRVATAPVAIPKAKFTGAVIIFLARLKALELLISSGRIPLTSSDLFIAISNTIFRGKRRVSINPVAIPRMKLPVALNASTTGEYQCFCA